MASIPTKNSVPSENYDDLRFNAGKLDEFVTSPENQYTDRLGIPHLTARGLQNSVVGAVLPANNLSDLTDKDAALSNLGGGAAGIAVFKGVSKAAIRTEISAAQSGANSDITSITGLTTALSILQGGTGATTAPAARSALSAAASGNNTDITSIQGVTNATNAAAGKIGEVITNQTAATALTSGNAVNATSVSLTAGDWDIDGSILLSPSGTTLAQAQGALSTTSGSLTAFPQRYQLVVNTSADIHFAVPRFRVNVSATTTVYLVASTIFSGGSASASGFIRARRMR